MSSVQFNFFGVRLACDATVVGEATNLVIYHNEVWHDADGVKHDDPQRYDLVIWGSWGRNMAKYLTTGREISIGGARHRTYTRTDESGERVSYRKLTLDRRLGGFVEFGQRPRRETVNVPMDEPAEMPETLQA